MPVFRIIRFKIARQLCLELWNFASLKNSSVSQLRSGEFLFNTAALHNRNHLMKSPSKTRWTEITCIHVLSVERKSELRKGNWNLTETRLIVKKETRYLG